MSETDDQDIIRKKRELKKRQQRRQKRMLKLMFDPVIILAALGVYAAGALFVLPEGLLEQFLTPKRIAAIIATISLLLFISKYLGILPDQQSEQLPSLKRSTTSPDTALLREVRNYLAHAPRTSATAPSQINIDDAFKGQLLARLTTESQSALSSFIESEIFKKSAESHFKESERTQIVGDIDQMISAYQLETASWRKNANVNLLIGLICAILGIGVMWQTLVTLNFELDNGVSWKVADLYRFLARLGLVLIIESVAFFFLKLYREDRSMIRYLRNEITNLETKCLSLKAALSFGSSADITKVLQSLSSTERNFIVKKGERVMSEITYENSEIILEKLLNRNPEFLAKLLKPAPGAAEI